MIRRHFIATVIALCYVGAWGAPPRPHPPPTEPARRPGPFWCVGDSLSAEYGLQARHAAGSPLLEKRLAAEKIPAQVVNASISGDTTSGGRSRLAALLAQHKPAHRGDRARRQRRAARPAAGHDRGQPDADDAGRAKGRRARCCWSACRCRPTTAATTRDHFAALSPRSPGPNKAALVPFLLKGIADGPSRGSCSRPTASTPRGGAAAMLDNVWPELKKLLQVSVHACSRRRRRCAQLDASAPSSTPAARANIARRPSARRRQLALAEQRGAQAGRHASTSRSTRSRRKKRGAALVARNIARHIEREVLDKPKRLAAADLLLARRQAQRRAGAGAGADRLQGGAGRRRLQGLPRRRAGRPARSWPRRLRYRVVCGPTGSGKTRLLQALAQAARRCWTSKRWPATAARCWA